jgi:hypothetical protein
MDGGQVVTLSYICGLNLYLEQGSNDSHKVIGKDIHAKECRHSRIVSRWKRGIPWSSMEESEIRISSFSKSLHRSVV